MKRKLSFHAALCAAAFLIGCKPADNPSANDQTAPPQIDQVRKETREALKAANDYAYAQRKEFAAKMNAELEGLKEEMNQLAAHVEKSNAATKDEAAPRMKSLQERSDTLREKLDELKNATEATWEDVKAGVSKGADELKESVTQARHWLSEKLASRPSRDGQ
jgi:cytochrome c553